MEKDKISTKQEKKRKIKIKESELKIEKDDARKKNIAK